MNLKINRLINPSIFCTAVLSNLLHDTADEFSACKAILLNLEVIEQLYDKLNILDEVDFQIKGLETPFHRTMTHSIIFVQV